MFLIQNNNLFTLIYLPQVLLVLMFLHLPLLYTFLCPKKLPANRTDVPEAALLSHFLYFMI